MRTAAYSEPRITRVRLDAAQAILQACMAEAGVAIWVSAATSCQGITTGGLGFTTLTCVQDVRGDNSWAGSSWTAAADTRTPPS